MKPRRLAAGIVVVRQGPEGLRVLALRAYRNWDFPKGLVEAGEAPLAAARRETAEETGIVDLEFAWGHEYAETEPYAGNKVARYYVARTRSERVTLGPNPEIGRPEHHEYRWLAPAAAARLLPPRLQPILAWALRRAAAPPQGSEGLPFEL